MLRRQALYPLSYGRLRSLREVYPTCVSKGKVPNSVLANGVESGWQGRGRAATIGRLSSALRCGAYVFDGAEVHTLVQDGAREGATIHLSEDDVAYLMNLLRNSTQPVTTQQLIDALRRQSTPAQPESGSGDVVGNQA